MSEFSRLPQELASFESGGEIVMSMTGAAFDEAQQQGVIHLSPNREAMTAIARSVGYIGTEDTLPPLVLFARSGESARSLIGRWDDRWPQYDNQPIHGRYFSAATLSHELPANGPAREIAAYASHIGARAISEITIEDWKEETSHIGAFATALLLGQRPMQPPKRPSILNRAVSDLLSTNETQRHLNTIKKVAQNEALQQPFIIVRAGQTAIER